MANEQNLKPFRKGDPAPPNNGRPKGKRSLTTILRDMMEATAPKELWQQNENLKKILDELGVTNPTNGDLLTARLYINALKGDNKAIEMIQDRIEGKAKQDVTITDGGKVRVGFGLDDEQEEDNDS